MMQFEREKEVDLAKGLAMLLMISGHCNISGLFAKFTVPFRVPFFFLISGYLFKDRDRSCIKMVWSKAKGLLIPYFSFGIFHIILYLLMVALGNEYVDCSPLYCLLVDNSWGSMPIHGIQCFLTAMFVGVVAFSLVQTLCRKREWIKICISFAISLIGAYYTEFLDFRFPLSFGAGLTSVGLMEMGLLMRKYWDKLDNSATVFITLLLYFPLVFVNGETNMRTETYNYYPLFILCASIGSFLIIWIMKRLKHCTDKCMIFILDELSFIGRNSIVYLCLNELVIIIIYKGFNFLSRVLAIPQFARNIGTLMISTVFLHFIALLFKKKPFCYLIGRF